MQICSSQYINSLFLGIYKNKFMNFLYCRIFPLLIVTLFPNLLQANLLFFEQVFIIKLQFPLKIDKV